MRKNVKSCKDDKRFLALGQMANPFLVDIFYASGLWPADAANNDGHIYRTQL